MLDLTKYKFLLTIYLRCLKQGLLCVCEYLRQDNIPQLDIASQKEENILRFHVKPLGWDLP